MEIKFNIKHTPKPPCMVSHYMHGDVNRMKRNIEQAGKANISIRRRTKTTLDINLWFDKDDFGVAHIPAGADKFKFAEKTDYSFFDGEAHTHQYFRISKKQNLPELKEYLKLVLQELNLSIETLEVDMNIIGVEELNAA